MKKLVPILFTAVLYVSVVVAAPLGDQVTPINPETSTEQTEPETSTEEGIAPCVDEGMSDNF